MTLRCYGKGRREGVTEWHTTLNRSSPSLEYPADKREKNLPMMRKYSDTFGVLISWREGEMEVMKGLILRKSLGVLRSSGRNRVNRSHSFSSPSFRKGDSTL